MHTTKLGHDIVAHHDGDYGGDVTLVVPDVQVTVERGHTVSVTVPFEALKELVASYVRGEAIEFYEQASADEVLRRWR